MGGYFNCLLPCWCLCLLPPVEIWPCSYKHEGLRLLGYLYFKFCIFCSDQSCGIIDNRNFSFGQCKMEDSSDADSRNHCIIRHRICCYNHNSRYGAARKIHEPFSLWAASIPYPLGCNCHNHLFFYKRSLVVFSFIT